jgi:hypothetical protein
MEVFDLCASLHKKYAAAYPGSKEIIRKGLRRQKG